MQVMTGAKMTKLSPRHSQTCRKFQIGFMIQSTYLILNNYVTCKLPLVEKVGWALKVDSPLSATAQLNHTALFLWEMKYPFLRRFRKSSVVQLVKNQLPI